MKFGVVVLVIVLVFTLGVFFDSIVLTGSVVEVVGMDYSWTSAICDEENNCLDVLIECSGGNVVGIVPVSGFIDHPSDWIDPRDIKEYC